MVMFDVAAGFANRDDDHLGMLLIGGGLDQPPPEATRARKRAIAQRSAVVSDKWLMARGHPDG
jgi:hypothetical protein